MAVEFSNTPSVAVIIVCVMVAIIASATWKNAKGEGWGLVVFLISLIVGFNLSVEFAVYFLQWISSTFSSLSNMIEASTEFGQGTGLLAVIAALAISVYVMRTIKFDSVRFAALGALYGILLRLLLDFLYWLATAGVVG
jgi:hypothetical protein